MHVHAFVPGSGTGYIMHVHAKMDRLMKISAEHI